MVKVAFEQLEHGTSTTALLVFHFAESLSSAPVR